MVIQRMSDYSNKIDYAIEKGSQFINDNPKIVKETYKIISYNDEPKLYGYAVNFKDKYSSVDNKDSVAAGVSFNKKRALLKVLGETIERYSLGANNDKKFTYKSFNELVALNKSALSLENLILFSDKKLYISSLDKKKFHWVEGKSLISNKKNLVPAQLIFVPYLYQNSESLLRFPMSTGAATGFSLEEALYRGICEIVERDAFIISYLNKLPSPEVDLSSMEDSVISDILHIFNRYKLEIAVFDLTTDLQIPAFAAITLDRTGFGPAVSVGLKAGFDIKETIIGAIEESLMVRSWIRDKFIYTDPDYKRRKEIISIEDRAHFWLPVFAIKHLDFWLKSKNLRKINMEDPKYSDGNLKKTVKLLKEKNMETIYVDITDKNIKRYGFVVVKVIIPKLHPLYLDERYPYLGGERLYNAPVKIGLLQSPKTESQLNKIPHPFL